MAKLSVQAGSTGVSVNLFIQASTSTTGRGLTGIAHNAAGLTCYYMRQRTTATPVTLATSTVGNPWVSAGFIEIDATNAAGWYNFDVPNAILGTGSPFASVHFEGAANMAPLPLEVELTAWNNQDATAGGINNLSSGGTLGSVSNVRGTATVQLAPQVHTGAVVPIVQTASNLGGTVVLAAQVHTGAIVPIVQTASNLGGTVVLAPQTHTSAVIPVVQTGSVMVSVASTGRDQLADTILDRDMSVGADSGSTSVRTPRQALRFLRNKWQIATGTLTVFKEDDATASWTGTITSTSSAEIIIGNDPAG